MMRLISGILVLAMMLSVGGCGQDGGSRPASVEVRAMAAYRAGEYEKALPLLKEWATKVHSDKEQFLRVMGYIVEAEKKLGKVTDPVETASAPSTTREGGGRGAEGVAKGPIDPSTGRPRVPHEAIKGAGVRSMTIKQLGNFDFDPMHDADVPEDVRLLDGAKVRLRGYIVPWNQAERITDFALVPSLTSCCFGQPPGPQHVVSCRFPKGRSMAYTMEELAVEGTLRVNVKREDGYSYSVFELDVTSVKYAD